MNEVAYKRCSSAEGKRGGPCLARIPRPSACFVETLITQRFLPPHLQESRAHNVTGELAGAARSSFSSMQGARESTPTKRPTGCPSSTCSKQEFEQGAFMQCNMIQQLEDQLFILHLLFMSDNSHLQRDARIVQQNGEWRRVNESASTIDLFIGKSGIGYLNF